MELSSRAGILTYHRAINYGSVLQAAALLRAVEGLGVGACVIDFRQEVQERMYGRYEDIRGPLSVARNGLAFLQRRKLAKRDRRFRDFRAEYLNLTREAWSFKELSVLSLDLQYLIAGSDQVWNARCADFSPAYLFEFEQDKGKCLSYAASLGRPSIPQEYLGTFQQSVAAMRAVSVREISGSQALADATGRRADVVLDPVLLHGPSDWAAFEAERQVDQPYIFCYFVGEVEGMRAYARRVSKELGAVCVFVKPNLRDLGFDGYRMVDAGPKEFLSLIRHAELVVTDSFHAMCFSLLYRKQFWAFVPRQSLASSRSRLDSLAGLTGVRSRIVDSENVPDSPIATINFDQVDAGLSKARKSSFAYLKAALM